MINTISEFIGFSPDKKILLQEERGVYLIDEMFQWSTATTIFENFFLPPPSFPFVPRAASSWDYVRGVCRDFFSNTAVLDYLRSSHYDVAIVDLIQNECMLALPVSMGVPVVGFWMTLPIGLELEYSTQPSNPSYVPHLMSGLTEKMNFVERVQNFVLKLGINIMTQVHFYINDQAGLLKLF